MLYGNKLCNRVSCSKVVHRLGWFGFGPELHSTRLGHVTGNWTRIRPNIQVGSNVSSCQLEGLELSVEQVWAKV